MSKKNIIWLYNEIPRLVSKDILTEEDARKIKNYYGEVEKREFIQIFLIVFGILGAVLIGLGIILLFAYNWDNLPKFLRIILSFLPLVASQFLCSYTLIRNKSIVWKEGTSVFLMISIGACIGLLAQIYNISEDFARFLLIWMLLSFPLIYLFDSNIVSLLYLIGITWWAGYVQYDGRQAVLFWILFLLVIPRLIMKIMKDKYSISTALLFWTLSSCLCIAIGITLEKVMPGLWIIVYSSFFCTLYLSYKLFFQNPPRVIDRHLYITGIVGLMIVAYILTYNWPWEEIGFNHLRHGARFNHYAAIVDYLITGLLLISSVGLLIYSLIKKQFENIIFGAFPVLISAIYVIIGTVIFNASTQLAIHLIINFYILGTGITAIIFGTRLRKLYLITFGTLIISILILLRFVFVEEFFENMIARGIIFILIGASFLASNFVFAKIIKRGKIEI